jgi:hypothetical protein
MADRSSASEKIIISDLSSNYGVFSRGAEVRHAMECAESKAKRRMKLKFLG